VFHILLPGPGGLAGLQPGWAGLSVKTAPSRPCGSIGKEIYEDSARTGLVKVAGGTGLELAGTGSSMDRADTTVTAVESYTPSTRYTAVSRELRERK
jgi:hypothetical protein